MDTRGIETGDWSALDGQIQTYDLNQSKMIPLAYPVLMLYGEVEKGGLVRERCRVD